MAKFINLDSGNKLDKWLLHMHLKLVYVWFVIFILIFRFDEFILNNIYDEYIWIRLLLISLSILTCIYLIFKNKWYFLLLIPLYPALVIFWFFPKIIFINGKIYLLYEYIYYAISKIISWKKFLFDGVLLLIIMFILVLDESTIKYYFLIFFISYKYWPFLIRNIISNFNKKKDIDISIISKLKEYRENTNFEKSLAKAYIIQESDEKLEADNYLKIQERRGVLALIFVNSLKEKVKSFKTKRAFSFLWIFKVFIILIFSIIYFWALNISLFRIDSDSFLYNGTFATFDFLYYTLKTMTFGDIDLVKPNNTLTRLVEIISYFVIGIVLLVYMITFFISFNQESLKERLNYSNELCEIESNKVKDYLTKEFKTDISQYILITPNIQSSIDRINRFLNSIF